MGRGDGGWELEDTTMPTTRLARHWVHKQFDANVFIGEPVALGNGEYAVDSAFPVHHEFYNDSLAGLSASGYLIEVARQANLALCHRFLDVPLESAFLVTAIDWQFAEETAFVASELEPFTVTTTVSEVLRRRGAVCKLRTRSLFGSSGRLFLAGNATFLISSRAPGTGHAEVQGPAAEPPLPVPPSDAQVRRPSAVLIGRARGDRIPLVVDPTHPYFFEHPNVHVPGMLLLEGGKQAAVYAALRAFSVLKGTYGDLHAGQIRFGRFADLRAPIHLTCHFVALEETRSGFRLPVDIEFAQNEREIGRISGALAFLDAEEAVQTSAILRRRIEESGARAVQAQSARGEAL
jgi:2-oxo-3-(phosphooxy)propyl 3-oxoalkanoate synthase